MTRRTDTMMWAAVLVVLLAVSRATGADGEDSPQKPDWTMPVLNAMVCPLTKDFWACGREQAVRMLDVFEMEIEQSKQEVKDEADADLAERIAQRAFSESDVPKEKPSDLMTTLDTYISNGIYSFMGRKDHDHMKKKKKPIANVQFIQVEPQHQQHQQLQHDEDDEDEEDDDDYEPETEISHSVSGGGGGGHHHNKVGGIGGHHHGPHRKPLHAVGAKPLKHKYGRDLGGSPQPEATSEYISSSFRGLHFKRSEVDIIFKTLAKFYGPAHGFHQMFKLFYEVLGTVTRGKKHKKKFKKALMKMLVIGTILKAKLELFLKVVGTHLQLKFFIIAVLGLLINVAKFWIDLKKGHQPQKVIYYEHAQHQHHYDEHDDGWGGGGGYWKRSFGTADPDTVEARGDKQLADQSYRQLNGPLVAHQIAYSQQIPEK